MTSDHELIANRDYVELARRALEIPSDYYSSNDDEGITEGRSGFSTHRDADIYTRANWQDATEHFLEKYPDEAHIQRSSHWAVGWCEELIVRIVIDPDAELTEDNITDVFKECMEWMEVVLDEGYLDESTVSDLEYEEQLEDMLGWDCPSWFSVPEGMTKEDAAVEASSFLRDWDEYPESGDNYNLFSREQIHMAYFLLGYFDEKDVEDILDDTEGWNEDICKEFSRWCMYVKQGTNWLFDPQNYEG